MISLSTHAKNNLLINFSFRELFNAGYLWLYTGTQPVSADVEVTDPWMAAITSDGLTPNLNPNELLRNSLSFSFTATNGVLNYTESLLHTWHIYVALEGTPTWFRFTDSIDLPTGSGLTKSRFDGAVGEDLIITKSLLLVTDTEIIDTFSVYL